MELDTSCLPPADVRHWSPELKNELKSISINKIRHLIGEAGARADDQRKLRFAPRKKEE